MNIKSVSGLLALVGSFSLGLASTANANELCLTFDSSRGAGVDINFDSSASYDAGSRNGGTTSICGLLFMSLEGGGTISAFCAEFTQPVQPEQQYCYESTLLQDMSREGTTEAIGQQRALAIQAHYAANYNLIDDTTGNNTDANTDDTEWTDAKFEILM